MEKKQSVKAEFPKSFFQKERTMLSLKDTLKDVIPVKWVKKNKSKKLKNKSFN